MINIFNFRKHITLKKADFKESLAYDDNPSRGWYRVYHYKVEEQLSEDVMKSVLRQDEQLVLVEINIGSYNDRQLDDYALNNIRYILDFWKRNKKDIILRVLYDNEGKGLEKEPLSIKMVENHMMQIGEIIRKYKDAIYVLQGIFIGSWGEMHGSKFLSKSNLVRLVRRLYEATGGDFILSVRKPMQWRMIYDLEKDEIKKSLFDDKMKIGLYNDAIMGSDTDMGTYDNSNKEKGKEKSWDRNSELDFQDNLCMFVPCGGEVINDNPLNDLSSAVAVMKKMHVTYLHSIYDANVIDKWKKSIYSSDDCFNGITGYEYISMHLGYRFVIRDVNIDKTKKNNVQINAAIENTGFANIYDQCSVYAVSINQEGKREEYLIETDILAWDSSRKTDVKFNISFKDQGDYKVYLMIKRKKDDRIIKFSNWGAGNMALIGSFTYCK